MIASHRHIAKILKAIGHPVRYCIVENLVNGEHKVNDMVDCLSVAQPTVSQHLRILKAAGIITSTRAGNEMHYSVCSPEVIKIINSLK